MINGMRSVVIAVALLSAVASCTLVAFSADITVLYDPDLQGALKGRMWYHYDGSTNYKKLQFNLTTSSGTKSTYTQLYNYSSSTLYLRCPSNCTASIFKTSIESFFPLSGESNGTASGCSSNTRSSSTSGTTVNKIGFYKNGLVCWVVYGDGKRIEFSNVEKMDSSTSVFSISGWGCPARSCNVVMDLMLILDVSGSIDNTAYATLKDFSAKLATAFTISSSAVNMGVIAFSSYADTVLDISSSASAVQTAISNVPRIGSSTCIGCGVYSAVDSFSRVSSSRTALKPKNVTIMITDGGNNYVPSGTRATAASYLSASLTALKSSPYNTLSIVVALTGTSDYTASVVSQIASNSTYIIPTTGYSTLLTIIDKVISTTCQDYDTTACSSTTCMGFCGCSGECLCPNYCPTGGDSCISSSCSTISNVLGCWNTSVTCSDGAACTTDTCDSSSGCVYTNVDCSSSDLCANPVCSNKTGCYTQPVVCTETSNCYTYACNSADGKCHATAINCDDNNSCTVDYCSSSSGCMHYTNCSDGDPCTDDTCVNKKCVHTATTCAASDLCHNATCQAGVGCVSTAITCASLDSCHSYSCSTSTGKCVQDALADNTTCLNCAKNPCNSSSVATCSFYICTEDSSSTDGTGRKCTKSTNISSSSHPCNDGNPCTTDSCDSTGCHNTAFDGTISGDLCSWKTCDTSTGVITLHNTTCTSSSACSVPFCDKTTGSCGTTDYCAAASSNCTESVCTVLSNGTASCTYPSVCSDTACSIASCSNGFCSYTARDCDDSKFCTIDTCDTSVTSGSGCTHTANSCSDGNSCTNDTCDETTQQCYHNTSYCSDGLSCTTDTCTPNSNSSLPPKCTFTEITCTMNYTLNLTDKQNRCYQALCSESEGCHWEFVESSNTSECKTCVKNATSSTKGSCTSSGVNTTAAAIAAGVLAGIIIACIIGFAAFSAASAAGTYKLIQAMKASKGLAAHNNPMYKPSDNEAVNPAYAAR